MKKPLHKNVLTVHKSVTTWGRKPFAMLLLLGCLLITQTTAQVAVSERAEELLRGFREVNRYWLIQPPDTLKNFSYTLQRIGGTQQFEVESPGKSPRARLHATTYSSALHRLAKGGDGCTVVSFTEQKGEARLELKFDPPLRGAIGNGVENSWNGYHTFGGSEGYVVLDVSRFVPVEAGIGRLRERFSEYAQVDETHLVPLSIQVEVGDTKYDWLFRLYEPGLWLLDQSHSGERKLSWTEQVIVNEAPAVVQSATEISLLREQQSRVGDAALTAFLKANRQWLLPRIEERCGLVYEYRQEPPYLERVVFDRQGNVLATLLSSKSSPEQPTSQRLWAPEGMTWFGDTSDQFVQLSPATPLTDRLLQHLFSGLALDCAITRAARNPDAFQAEVRPVPNRSDRYLLVLHPKRGATLFTGTMLVFTSWCYMHDISYQRSEVLCNSATHFPIEEKDFEGEKLVGQYSFEAGLRTLEGPAPRIIRALIPHVKNDQDQSLEMVARFQNTESGMWLLECVDSSFHGGGGSSTGALTVLPTQPGDFHAIEVLLEKANSTSNLLQAIANAPKETSDSSIAPGRWNPFFVQAGWQPEARERALARNGDKRGDIQPQIALHQARVTTHAGHIELRLRGLSTVTWKEFETRWSVTLTDSEGLKLTGTTNSIVRAERGPSGFELFFHLPTAHTETPLVNPRLQVSGKVERITGAYHGHGMWMRFAR